MIDLPHILAASGDIGIVQILFVVAVVVVSLASKALQKAREKREAEAAARKVAERRSAAKSQPLRPAASPGGPTQRPAPSVLRPVQPAQPVRPVGVRPPALPPFTPQASQQAPPRRAVPRPPQVKPPEEHVRTIRDTVDLDQVDEEVDRMRQELATKVATRQRRLETAAPSEADTAAIGARISHFQRMEVQPDQVARVQVDLRTPQALRAAIIYHEIISPPKALRLGPELWDR